MTTINKLAIRKALEIPLEPALVAAGACLYPDSASKAAVQYPDLTIKTDGLLEYVRFSVHYADTRVIEMGNTPRRNLSGQAIATVWTRTARAQDRNDTIAGIIEAAYPYNAVLARDGVSVILAEVQPRDGQPNGVWWVSDVVINWQLWRQV